VKAKLNQEVKDMALVMVTSTYPPDKAAEVAAAWIRGVETPLPAFVKRLHVLVAPAGEMKSYSMFEVDAGKEDEGYKEILRRLLQFQIEGFRYHIEHVLPAEEAIPLLGL